MRVITKKASKAFRNNLPVQLGNTSVMVIGSVTLLLLHGHRIARKDRTGLFITAAGWKTNTTKERLNGLPYVWINQKAGTWYLNGAEWDGSWIKIEVA